MNVTNPTIRCHSPSCNIHLLFYLRTTVHWIIPYTVRNLAKKIDKITRLLSLQVVAEEEGAELTDKSTRKVSFILLQLDEHFFSLDS